MKRGELEQSLVQLKTMYQKGHVDKESYTKISGSIYKKIRDTLQPHLNHFEYPRALPTHVEEKDIKELDVWISVGANGTSCRDHSPTKNASGVVLWCICE